MTGRTVLATSRPDVNAALEHYTTTLLSGCKIHSHSGTQ